MEFDEHEEQEEIGPNFETPANISGRPKFGESARKSDGRTYRYRECQKNHAVGICGHAVDGCGEFIAAGDDGTLDGLRCAACNCHRNFHRKEAEGEIRRPPPLPQLTYHHHHHAAAAGYLHVTPPPLQQRPPALPFREDDNMSNPSSSGGGSGSSKKRFRTKFTPEQKEKMLSLAEKVGWRLQKQDEAEVEQFCNETGLKRHVLKVWMHNNKHTLGKKP